MTEHREGGMTVIEAQADMRRAYVGGGPGAFVSGLVWLAAAAAYGSRGIETGFVVLFLGGMLIFPLGLLLERFLFRRAPAHTDNPLGRAALECTIAMIGGLFAAWLFLPLAPQNVIPLAAIAVGTHYLVFRTVYGYALYWALGGGIAAIGFLDIFVLPGSSILAMVAVAAIEIGFAAAITIREMRVAADKRQVQSAADLR